MWFDPAHVEAVRDAFPEWTAFVFAFLSYLGSVWVVLPTVVLAYWFVDRRRFAPWLGTVIGCYAIMAGLKGVFAVSRPGVGPAISPAELPTAAALLYAPAVKVTTESFPSGHALAAVVLWGMLALETDVGTRRARLVAAGVVVALVGFSRIAVGLHYAADVVAGAAVGVAYLGVVLALRRRVASSGPEAETAAVLTLAGGLSLLSVLTAGRADVAALVGASVGALAGWLYASSPRDADAAGALGRPALAAGSLALLASIAVGGAVALPWLVAGAVVGLAAITVPWRFETGGRSTA
ncbi:phosphatase PAP2 family protein [Natrononativus amylolyticus]|uniref:phosphatase PAP2 family protein n=1 Tax=Natrononativus amylolyticus TaxID=2963434 RepID=UPI0020CF52D4|nr:phosphatase PAP2 family protein [Natrononativus amylolyticus]